jgi:hypothetical protein
VIEGDHHARLASLRSRGAPALGSAILVRPACGPNSNPDESVENSPAAAVQKKRGDCRQEGTSQGLRGLDLADHVAVCVLEARLTCSKQAIEQKARGVSGIVIQPFILT